MCWPVTTAINCTSPSAFAFGPWSSFRVSFTSWPLGSFNYIRIFNFN
jgi:hypothetical protein